MFSTPRRCCRIVLFLVGAAFCAMSLDSWLEHHVLVPEINFLREWHHSQGVPVPSRAATPQGVGTSCANGCAPPWISHSQLPIALLLLLVVIPWPFKWNGRTCLQAVLCLLLWVRPYFRCTLHMQQILIWWFCIESEALVKLALEILHKSHNCVFWSDHGGYQLDFWLASIPAPQARRIWRQENLCRPVINVE